MEVDRLFTRETRRATKKTGHASTDTCIQQTFHTLNENTRTKGGEAAADKERRQRQTAKSAVEHEMHRCATTEKSVVVVWDALDMLEKEDTEGP